MKKFNKKGMLDDMFDFLFTIMIAFFLFFFINIALSSGIEKSHEKSLDEVADMKRIDSAINNLRIQAQEGQLTDPEKVEEGISKSRILGGIVISSCLDYYTKNDCMTDTIKLYGGNQACIWQDDNNKCTFIGR